MGPAYSDPRRQAEGRAQRHIKSETAGDSPGDQEGNADHDTAGNGKSNGKREIFRG